MTHRPYSREKQDNDPVWLKCAFDEIGTMEIKGEKHHPRILGYHACTGLGATTDETPWCASFVCWVMKRCDIASTRSASSLSFLRWGRELKTPVRGCLVVFERVDRQGRVIPNRGHVGFWLGEGIGGSGNPVTYVLGGNQRDQVGINAYKSSRVVGYRWPSLPSNSTTNVASSGIAAGTIVAAAPSVIDLVAAVGDADPAVAKAIGTAQHVSDGLGVSLVSVVALLVVLAGVVYIVKERNRKIKQYGI